MNSDKCNVNASNAKNENSNECNLDKCKVMGLTLLQLMSVIALSGILLTIVYKLIFK